MPDHPDSYRSVDAVTYHRYTILLYYRTMIDYHLVEANCIADAVNQVAPGNDCYKVEIIPY